MDPFESRFERELVALIKITREEKTQFLAGGRALTIEEYRETVGYIRALDKVAEWSADLRGSIYGTRNDE